MKCSMKLVNPEPLRQSHSGPTASSPPFKISSVHLPIFSSYFPLPLFASYSGRKWDRIVRDIFPSLLCSQDWFGAAVQRIPFLLESARDYPITRQTPIKKMCFFSFSRYMGKSKASLTLLVFGAFFQRKRSISCFIFFIFSIDCEPHFLLNS